MRLIAVALGLLSALCALAFPFLPVVQDTAEVVWPTGSDTRSVNAPLTGYWAQDLRAELPCAAIRSVDARTNGPGLLFATVPDGRTDPNAGKGVGLQLRVDNGVLFASSQGQQIAQQPLPAEKCDVELDVDATQMTLAVAGTPIFHTGGDVRPRVVGIYSSINSGKDPIAGLHVSVVPDTRYQTSPTALKVGVGVVAILSLIGCMIAVWRRDSGFARRAPRWAPVGWWRLTLRDATVIAALGAWVFIGPVTSDDGYILTMARVTEQTGFLTNYHRWFGVAEAPFGWFYHVFELMAHVSVVPPWIRLPSFLLGVLCWLLISREVMPRLGAQVRTSRPASWAAATVFLVWWMPYNNGVRPEPVAALGSLLAICAVERTLVTRRLLPLCLGLTAAGFTLAATPTGLIAVAPFLVAARPLFKLVRQRANENGWLPVLAPVAAAGLLVLVVVFADQTFATVQEATRIRTQVGPNLSWFQELARYQLLFADLPDGSAPRRFPVLLIVLCTATCLVMLLRRGRIQGASLGPARRLIGTTALFFLLLALTPTKWTHHFGAFAAVGASMAALTALATSSTVLRSKRNRAAFLAGLLVVGALAATGPNTYWFVSRLGVQWTNVAPSIGGIGLSTILLVAAAIAGIYAFVENVRAHRPTAAPPVQEGRLRALRLGSLSLVVVCGLVAGGEFVTMAWAIHNQAGSYSLGAANVGHLFGKSCNLSDHVMVERDAATSILHPQTEQRTVADETKPPENSPLPNPDRDNGRVQTGFHTRPVDDKDPLAEPPHGFTPENVPMWSSYLDPETRAGRLRSDWYALTEKPGDGQVVVATAGAPRRPTSVSLDYGVNTPEGVKILRSQFVLPPGSGTGGWNDTRINLRDLPAETNAVRINIVDNDLTEDGWIAASAPRVPTFTTLTDKIGSKPVYIDWPASFVYPCAQPVTSHDGISQVPEYRITAGGLADEAEWASSTNGGPIGWLEELAEEPEVPSYLIGQPSQSWGQLLQIEPFTEGIAPTVIHGEKTVPGWWSPGPGPSQPNGKDPTR
ncbi:arabinosyltransferase domain-containing protein [Amycolatopsis sp., V23-08]|uniref:Arabinosyltransferase domain-containing protein n=1 Tax=Amycolatopsis heterodermiae TaxID=3110235 RepID=A0ABU5RJY9_9PSEU|nr:arabinosyltransferase domain-containing protein [Amycolatopsis sp., V23-08]MEA5365451.1 arabinosyltransferase domain-containing protein [Amycolatopsis sp., V23-08]